MKKSPFTTAIEDFRGAAKAALNEAKQYLPDRDVALYERMTPEAFQAISRKYGMDKTIQYIRTMESKRINPEGG